MDKRIQSPNYEQHLQDTLEDLKKDPTLSISIAAGCRGVKESTLRDRMNKGRQNPMSVHTYEYLLLPAQMDALVKWALFQDDMSIPLQQELLIKKVEAILYVTSLDVILE
jgi:hypothetical protein